MYLLDATGAADCPPAAKTELQKPSCKKTAKGSLDASLVA